ncbi:endonuclease [Nonlabens ponticola]|uniref:T9SS type A sorting domain-containing protein n=1 Tax=Nonlabens ponticola TaxID=2496866 RepID=A0A3S9MYI1_9FLAO|nr:endonuclease [Nonlabens ponticola]AZQ44301.1 T9SS type A sorting domain-containing protein [Nonlabens ponticola]
MKNVTLFFLLLAALATAQPPAGYYDDAQGLDGFELKTALSQIISDGYNGRSYNALLTLYQTSDNDEFYDGGTQTNTILDIYSENPDGPDPYNYEFSENCGNVGAEGTCYNREHIFPQGRFNSQEPMRSDAHHVVPTDGSVNGARGSWPFSEVNNPEYTSSNGSKRGPSSVDGYSGTAFEPIDEFKGDVARSLLYFATRYQDRFDDSSWDSPNVDRDPRDGSRGQFYEDWYINLLLKWHAEDPVSDREIDRNNEIFEHQNNRNPFIDVPQYVNQIWGTPEETNILAVTLSGTYVDLNNDDEVNVGDEIQYTYTITNRGTSTVWQISVGAEKGIFEEPKNLESLAPGLSSEIPSGILRYSITQEDIDSECNCVSNQVTATGNSEETLDGEIVTAISDDPDDDTNVDTDNDEFPDDRTVVSLEARDGSTESSELFISEYIEGSGVNKAIEIANFTGEAVDLSNYSLQRDTNGGGNWSSDTPLTGTLADGEVFVIANSGADSEITDEADVLVNSGTALDFNGNDPVGLFKNDELIDIVGNFGGGGADFAQNVTLVRKPEVTGPTVSFNLAAEWNEFPINTFDDLGSHTFGTTASVGDEVLANLLLYPNPSSTGLFFIKGDIQQPTVTVYDLAGRQIKKERVLGDSFIVEKAGIYIVKIEFADAVRSFKVVVE